MNSISPRRLEYAVSCIAAEIGARLLEASKLRVLERDLWNELTCCVLSSQVPYEMAKAAAQRINQSGVLWCSERPDRDVLRATGAIDFPEVAQTKSRTAFAPFITSSARWDSSSIATLMRLLREPGW
jgi:hypothetical protein